MRFRCLFSEDEIRQLRCSKVAICGIGGYGAAIIDAFARYEFEEIRLADPDIFEASNMDRQILARFSTIGQKKVDVASHLISDITRNTKVICFDKGVNQENVKAFCSSTDVVIDACDQLSARLLLRVACNDARIPLIAGGSRSWPDRFGLKVDIYRFDLGLSWEQVFQPAKWGISTRTWRAFMAGIHEFRVPENVLSRIDSENAVYRSRKQPRIFGTDKKMPWNSPGSYDPLKVMSLATGLVESTISILIGRSPEHHRICFELHDT